MSAGDQGGSTGPLSREQVLDELEFLATVEHASSSSVARAVDERYARLVPAVTTDPVFDGGVLDELRPVIVDGGQSYAAAFGGFRQSLGDLAAADVLRATRRDAADDFEQRLLDASDRAYRLTVEILGYQFTPQANDVVPFLPVALEAMTGLDDITFVLVQRGLLPPFTLT
jgi:hypothetical protein